MFTLDIARDLRPTFAVFENVAPWAKTEVSKSRGRRGSVLDVIKDRLGTAYALRAEIVNVAEYGVPRCRRRLIVACARDPCAMAHLEAKGTLMPPPTNAERPSDGRLPRETVGETIRDFERLDGLEKPASASDPLIV